MPGDNAERRSDVLTFLQSLRYSIDRSLRGQQPIEGEERENFLRNMMMIEEARLRFNSYIRFREEPSLLIWRSAYKELEEFIDRFGKADFFVAGLLTRRFTLVPPTTRERERASSFIKLLQDSEGRRTIADAMAKFQVYVENAASEIVDIQGSLPFIDIKNIVPRQQVAPIQFDIIGDRIVVSKTTPVVGEPDRANVQAALEHLSSSGNKLLDTLANSNCDKRLLESVRDLQEQIVSSGNVVRIGLSNLACDILGSQFKTELSDAVVGMLSAYSRSISLYVAQFPDWQQFTQKAALVDLTESDISQVDDAAKKVIDLLTAKKDFADPEVPKTISAVRQFLATPGISSKRATFALLRTIENLVSVIIQHSADFLNETAKELVKSGSKAASKVILGLLSIALVSALGIGQAAMHAGSPWVKQVAGFVEQRILELSK